MARTPEALTVLAVLACQAAVTAAAIVAVRGLGAYPGPLSIVLGAVLIVAGTVMVKHVLEALDQWLERRSGPLPAARRRAHP